ncbi:MAG: metallopeptidase TldD-related protein [Rectinemataceae bacterium]
MSANADLEARFGRAVDLLLGELRQGEELSLDFAGEDSRFLRFNEGKVRQTGSVEKASVDLTYYKNAKTLHCSFSMSGDEANDAERAAAALGLARSEAALLPEDPFQTLPAGSGSSREAFTGKLPSDARLAQEVLGPSTAISRAGAAFVGLHSQGAMARGAANSRGARHWFSTETFITDYSAFLPSGKALKSSYAGRDWDADEYARRLGIEGRRLEALALPDKVLKPGEYRVWLAPDAFAEFMAFFSWRGLGERDIREGESAWIALKEGRQSLSPRFRLSQDFSLGVQQRFNERGEVAPDRLPLIEGGKLANTLVSARSALQYGVVSNAAPEQEYLRSPAVDPGDLDEDSALAALGSGLYISNLHYLNWSDIETARVTGMTRFACFWVEDGKIVAPIKDMRFDESLYQLFGHKLAGLSRQRSLIVSGESYFMRALDGALLPGALVEGFTFTL